MAVVIIAEKPSVAEDIAKVLGVGQKTETHWLSDDIVITWAVGHLLQLKYMDDYVSNVKIAKTEPNATYSNGRAPITFILENAYPYSIDAVPLSYGSSQIARVNVNFYYSRHTVSYGDSQAGQIRIPVLP